MTDTSIVKHLLPFVPPLGLLAAIHTFAVNVPTGSEWDLIPIVAQLASRPFTWTALISERLSGAKMAATWLALATNFDVTYAMYVGFCLQLLAFIFLFSVLELTLRAWHKRLIVPLAVAVALLMFSLSYDRTWLAGVQSLEAGVITLTAAVICWLLTHWPQKVASIVLSLLLGLVGGLPGSMLWVIVLTAVSTQSLVERKIQWSRLTARVLGVLLVSEAYLAAFSTTAPRYVFLDKPLDSFVSVLAYLGWPLTQVSNVALAAAASAAGLVLLIAALSGIWHDAKEVRSILPWFWLCTYSVVAAVLAASKQLVQTADSSGITHHTVTSFFWIGLAVIASLASDRRSSPQLPVPGWLSPIVVVIAIVCSINYARAYTYGYFAFEERQTALTGAVLEMYAHQTARDDELFGSLDVDADRAREYVTVLERLGLGPFAPNMLRQRSRLEAAIPVTKKPLTGQGYLDVATCNVVSGWAWDARQPNVSVQIQISDGETLLGTVAAYRFRPDLQHNNIGTGRYGFMFEPPPILNDGHGHTIHAKIAGLQDDITDSPKQVICQ